MHVNFLIFTPFSDTVLTSSTALLGPSVRGGGYRQSSTSWTLHREELPLSWRSWVHVFSNNIIYLAFSPVICKPTFHLYLLCIVHVFYTLWRAVLCSFCYPCFCPHSTVYYSYPWCHLMAVLSTIPFFSSLWAVFCPRAMGNPFCAVIACYCYLLV